MIDINNLITDNIDVWTSAIKKKSATGRGSSKKIELTGIKKLRELILELAVRGKLVSQDPNDEPASVLLERISEERAELIADKKIKKNKPLAEITPEEKLFELPVGWDWCRLGEISDANTGFAFKSGQYQDSGHFVLRVTNINSDGSIDMTDSKFIDGSLATTTFDKYSLSAEDVLLVMVGGSLGKIGIVSEECLPAVLNQNMWKLSKYGGMSNRYFTTGIKFINSNQLTITKSTHGHLSQGDYLEKLFPLPPLAEQQLIVAKIDELMALCDELEQQTEQSLSAHQTLVEVLLATLTNSKNAEEFSANWQRISAHFDVLFTTEASIDQLKQTILQLAVMGKLVPQNPSDEPASKLLEKIAEEKAQLIKDKKIKKQKLLPTITDEEKPFELSQSWSWSLIDNVFSVTGGLQKTPKRTPVDNFYPYLAVANVQRGFLELQHLKYFEVNNDELDRYKLEVDDLMVVEGNGSENEIGRCAIWKGDVDNCLHQNHLIRCRPYFHELSNWCLLTLNSPHGINTMKSLAVTSSGLYNLSVGKIRAIYLPVPPLAEQHRIVAKVDELMALCDQLKSKLADAQTTQLHLAEAVVSNSLINE